MSPTAFCVASFLCLLSQPCILAQVAIPKNPGKTFGALVITKDGRSLQAEFAEGQSLVVQDGQDGRTLVIRNILWLLGDEKKYLRLEGSRALISGTIQDSPLKFMTLAGSQMLNAEEIVFMFKWPSSERYSEVAIVESTDEIWSFGTEDTGPAGVASVAFFPSNLQGQVKLSNPRYPKTISSGVPFILNLDIEGDDGQYGDITKTVLEKESAVLLFAYQLLRAKDTGKGGWMPLSGMTAHSLLRNAQKGDLPSEIARKKSVPVEITLGAKAASRLPGQFIYAGEGSIYLFLAELKMESKIPNFQEEYAQGKVKVTRSISNVLRIQVEFEDPSSGSLPPK